MIKTYGQSTFIQRLEMFITSRHKSRKDFSKAIGFSISTLNGYFSRGTSPSYDFFDKFLEIYSPDDMHWLIKGQEAKTSKASDTSSTYYTSSSPYERFNLAFKEIIQAEIKATASDS